MSIDNSLKLSVEMPKIEDVDQQLIEVKDEQFFINNLNDSLDIFNILKHEERCDRPQCFNSKERFSVMMKSIEKNIDHSHKLEDEKPKTLKAFAEEYNQIERPKLEGKKGKLLEIMPINSDQEGQSIPDPLVDSLKRKSDQIFQNYRALLPQGLRGIVTEMPQQYLQALQNMQAQPEIKSDRRRRVERYLEKRRLKTWDKKICYNCRQKVAEERLRVKGRFIGRKKAIEMLGLTDRRNTSEIKHLLDNINRKQE